MPRPVILCLVALLWAPMAEAEVVSQRNGSDLFLSGGSGLPEVNTLGDVFAAGQSVVLNGRAGGDVHAAGFDVSVELPVAGDLYAAGAAVAILAPVAEDVTAMGMSVRTSSQAAVQGNARLMGQSVLLDGPVNGALTVTAGELTLNSAIDGDVLMVAPSVHFGPEARIRGHLVYAAEAPIEVPEEVIAPDRVIFRKLVLPETVTDLGESWRGGRPFVPAARIFAQGMALILGVLVLVGAATLALAPVWSGQVRRRVAARPGAALLAGVLGVAAMFGLLPVAILSVIGLPLLPLILAAVLFGWMMGYLMGVHTVAFHVARGFGMGESPGLLVQILILTVGLLGMVALNFVPIIGWLANFLILLVGAGGIVLTFFRSPIPGAPDDAAG